jgi:hypothetical protein
MFCMVLRIDIGQKFFTARNFLEFLEYFRNFYLLRRTKTSKNFQQFQDIAKYKEYPEERNILECISAIFRCEYCQIRRTSHTISIIFPHKCLILFWHLNGIGKSIGIIRFKKKYTFFGVRYSKSMLNINVSSKFGQKQSYDFTSSHTKI